MDTFEVVDVQLPVVNLRTRALWIDVPLAARQEAEALGLDFTASMHGAHHVLLNW